jgi:hypothetical protein
LVKRCTPRRNANLRQAHETERWQGLEGNALSC